MGPVDPARLARLTDFFAGRPDLGVVSVYLFGSQAEGRAHRESDIDLAVLLGWQRHPTERLAELRRHLAHLLDGGS